ncbi:MAG: hypothetical protein HUU55_10810 [Myxococcales bacterium]|nr:hypothetical protein [Myxococcales bacterium]
MAFGFYDLMTQLGVDVMNSIDMRSMAGFFAAGIATVLGGLLVGCGEVNDDGGVSTDSQAELDLAYVADLGEESAPDVSSDVGKEGTADSTDEPDGETPDLPYARCPYSTRSGRFTVDLKESSTSIDGVVADGVVPQNVPTVTLSEGGCSLLYPTTLFCEPACEPNFTCDVSGSCIPYPQNQSVGLVGFLGLWAPFTLKPIPPQQIYYYRGSMPHPAFSPNHVVTLQTYFGEHSSFSIAVMGVVPLKMVSESLLFHNDKPATLLWEKAESSTNTAIFVTASLANHGGVPARIECVAPDSGEFTIPATLVAALLDIGYSGFPTVAISRESASSTTTELGCIELVLQSEVVLDVSIDGLISCSSSQDCPFGQTCMSDLHCQ